MEYLVILGLMAGMYGIYFLYELGDAWLDGYKARKAKEIREGEK